MASSVAPSQPAQAPAVVDLRSQAPAGLLGVGAEPIRLTWRIEPALPGLSQSAFEIEVCSDDHFEIMLASSGVVESADQVAVAAPGSRLRGRETRHYRVRIRTELGWTPWSPSLRVEAGLLEQDDWQARAITLPDDPGRKHQAPAPLLRRQFDVPGDVASARLYVTAHGVHRVTLNGIPVSDELLSPGWTTYHRRLLADTYDLTHLLRAGANVLVAALGDGWYRGRLGWDPVDDRCHYGRDVALLAQLEFELADGTRHQVVTDEGWLAATGEIRSADIYDGSDIDLRQRQAGYEAPGFDRSGWVPAAVVPLNLGTIAPRAAPPVRVVERWLAQAWTTGGPSGALRLDAGQNLSGYLRLRVKGSRGDTVTVRHAEVLEPDGSLHTRSLRSAKATDRYTLADDAPADLEPAFTFHGFRYAEIETEAEVLGVEFVAISSDLSRRGWFECSDARLTRLHENVVWSQRDNFVSVPTDCPQRDERLGWSGDAQAFAPTSCTLFDSHAFWASWLEDLALDQDDVLGVPSVVPDVVLSGEWRYGRAGWADAATMVPWAVFEATGDATILARQLDSMTRWVDSLRARQGPDGLLAEGLQFGDWLDPDAPIERPWETKTDSRYLANAFFAHSARLLARTADVLGERVPVATYRNLADRVAAATWREWAAHVTTTQTAAAAALQFDIAPPAERAAVAAALARLVRESEGRVATGFLGTPLVLPALADAGYFDEAYMLLLRTDVPSWLYQVARGATTVWERWDAIRPDGTIHPGTMTSPSGDSDAGEDGNHMLSFNHYAYGAVIDWVYRHVAGLAPDIKAPGYRHVVLAPRPARGIDWARARVACAYGLVAIDWHLDGSRALVAEVELPFGTSGTFVAPVTAGSRVTFDAGPGTELLALGPGRHTIRVTSPRVADGSSERMISEVSAALA